MELVRFASGGDRIGPKIWPGDIWFVSLAGSYLANVDMETGAATVYEPPTKDRGTRRSGT